MTVSEREYTRRAIVVAFGKISEGYGSDHWFEPELDYGRKVGVHEALGWGGKLSGAFGQSEIDFVKSAFARFDAQLPSIQIPECCLEMIRLLEGRTLVQH